MYPEATLQTCKDTTSHLTKQTLLIRFGMATGMGNMTLGYKCNQKPEEEQAGGEAIHQGTQVARRGKKMLHLASSRNTAFSTP